MMLRSSTSSGSGSSDHVSAATAIRLEAASTGCRATGVSRAGVRAKSARPRARGRRGRDAPMRQRAPVSSRINASPRAGRPCTRKVATTSTTSGSSNRPPTPTISIGTPRARSAASMRGNCRQARTSTAMLLVGSPAARFSCVGSPQRRHVLTDRLRFVIDRRVEAAAHDARQPRRREREVLASRRDRRAAAQQSRSRQQERCGHCENWCPGSARTPACRRPGIASGNATSVPWLAPRQP